MHRKKEDTFRLKLDFEKAFDRIEHDYLHATLENLGFSGRFVEAIKTLIEDVVSCVQFNGTYSLEFELKRGVRQGCPVAQLVFVIATQPFMDFLDHCKREKSYKGIHIDGDRAETYRLFADDMDLSFEDDEIFEGALGAKLNIEKSIFVPYYCGGDISLWICRSGCRIAAKGEVIRYLGSPIGHKIMANQARSFCAFLIATKLASWDTNDTSFYSRIVLIKHILHAIPMFLQISSHINKATWKHIENMCIRFP